MKAMVTSGAGFIGGCLVEELLTRGYDVVVIDNFSNGRMENLKKVLDNPKLKVVKADLKNDTWENEFRDAEVVFHFAANPEVRVSAIEPRIHFNENILASFNVLKASRKHDVGYTVFASSSTVYGGAKRMSTPENYTPLEPISVYSANKLAVEYMIYNL